MRIARLAASPRIPHNVSNSLTVARETWRETCELQPGRRASEQRHSISCRRSPCRPSPLVPFPHADPKPLALPNPHLPRLSVTARILDVTPRTTKRDDTRHDKSDPRYAKSKRTICTAAVRHVTYIARRVRLGLSVLRSSAAARRHRAEGDKPGPHPRPLSRLML